MSAMNAPEPEQPKEKDKLRLLRRRRDRPRMTLRERMPAEKLRKGVYLIPSLFTAGNLMCGFFSIIATFRGEYVNAALLILLAIEHVGEPGGYAPAPARRSGSGRQSVPREAPGGALSINRRPRVRA